MATTASDWKAITVSAAAFPFSPEHNLTARDEESVNVNRLTHEIRLIYMWQFDVPTSG